MPFPPPVAAPIPAPTPAPAPVVVAPAPVAVAPVVVIAAPAPLRYVLGPSSNVESPTAAVVTVATVVAKPDATVTIKSVDPVAWTVTVGIDPVDPAKNQFVEVRAYLAAPGTSLPVDAAGWVASANPVTVEDVSGASEGGDDVISLPVVAPGAYLIQIVLGFPV